MTFEKVREWVRNGNWGLKVLSLVLAIVVYHAVKTGQSASAPTGQNDRTTAFESR